MNLKAPIADRRSTYRGSVLAGLKTDVPEDELQNQEAAKWLADKLELLVEIKKASPPLAIEIIRAAITDLEHN